MRIFSLVVFLMVASSTVALASEHAGEALNLTSSGIGIFSLILLGIAYFFVMVEEYTQMRKSKPVLLAAAIIWGMLGWVYTHNGMPHIVEEAVRHNLLEYAELFLFLLVAMTYINAMSERQVFDYLRYRLVTAGFSLRMIFWLTGFLSFIISPVADNLTTALLMCAIAMAIAGKNKKFIPLACINIVVGANAGGAFSPFGDITTLMVWQKGVVEFWTFFHLFIPAAVNWFVPALVMSFFVSSEKPTMEEESKVRMKRGGLIVVGLFLCTIATAVSFHNFLSLPPVIGMMGGLSFLKFFGFYLKKTHKRNHSYSAELAKERIGDTVSFDIFKSIARAEWDTLFFFYGVILCVGGLGFIGYLSMASHTMYTGWGATNANIAIGVLSAIVDNIPVMFAVLQMSPDMSTGQWLLVTMTAGVGGSLLSIGSAAGVALMGQTKGMYTFFSHLKWTPAIALGYMASIWIHFLMNARFF